MPEKADIASFIADWWQFGVFLVGALIAYQTGKERQRFKIDQIGQGMERLSGRVDYQGTEIEGFRRELEVMRREENANALHSTEVLTKLITSQGHIIQTLDEIKEALKGKADK